MKNCWNGKENPATGYSEVVQSEQGIRIYPRRQASRRGAIAQPSRDGGSGSTAAPGAASSDRGLGRPRDHSDQKAG